MDVNSALNTYNLNTLWNTLNSNNSSTSAVSSITNIDENVNESYTEKNYFGETVSGELQDIYRQIEPDYSINLNYDKNGNIAMSTKSDVSSNLASDNDLNMISLFNDSNSASEDNSFNNILSENNSIENGSCKENISLLLSSNFSNLYSYINSLENNQVQGSGNNIDATL